MALGDGREPLGGDVSPSIFEEEGPTSDQIESPSVTAEGIAWTVATGSSGLSYDPTTGRYIRLWKAEKAWAGTYRQPVFKLTTVPR